MKTSAPPAGNYLATGFRDVDRAAAAKMAHCLTFLDSLPSFQEYKTSVLQAIDPQPGDIIADLGCGLGFDVLRFAELVKASGRAIGVDASLNLLESASARARHSSNVDFVQADIHHLPFVNESLTCCKVDRTLQHVDNPLAVLRDVLRALRPGGMVICSEPDWGTFTIDHDNRQAVEEVAAFWASSFRNPWIGRQLLNLLREAGYVDADVKGTLLIAPSFEASDLVFDLEQTALRLAQSTGSKEPLQWIASARERDRSLPVWSSVTLFITSAKKPL